MWQQTETTLTNRRLFAAADMLLSAIDSPTGFDSLVPMYAGSRPESASRPPDQFTAEELVDGMTMLIRLGLIDHVAHAPIASPPGPLQYERDLHRSVHVHTHRVSRLPKNRMSGIWGHPLPHDHPSPRSSKLRRNETCP
jgi:hypothetical protein